MSLILYLIFDKLDYIVGDAHFYARNGHLNVRPKSENHHQDGNHSYRSAWSGEKIRRRAKEKLKKASCPR